MFSAMSRLAIAVLHLPATRPGWGTLLECSGVGCEERTRCAAPGVEQRDKAELGRTTGATGMAPQRGSPGISPATSKRCPYGPRTTDEACG